MSIDIRDLFGVCARDPSECSHEAAVLAVIAVEVDEADGRADLSELDGAQAMRRAVWYRELEAWARRGAELCEGRAKEARR